MSERFEALALWPPQYSLRKHHWARHVKLKATVKHGLEIIVPARFNLKELPSLLETNREWIEKQILKLRGLQEVVSEAELPTHLELKALNEHWKITYLAADSRLRLLVRPGQEILLFGEIENKLACRKLLINWAKRRAKVELLKHLESVSLKINIPYAAAKVRAQSTRWGSCSSRKVLSLNYQLLFLRPELMQHVLIHELCHTIEMNHSDKFWQLVARFDAKWQEHRRVLKRAKSEVPAWAQL